MSDLPAEIVAFMQAVESLGGVESIEPTKWYLPDVPMEHTSLPDFANLPLAALRRSSGGLPGEVLISFRIRPERNEQGWRAIEFLSWWARDQARGGEQIQMRSLALPPEINSRIQLGTTLSFALEVFIISPEESIGQVLTVVQGYADSVSESKRIYSRALSHSNKVTQ